MIVDPNAIGSLLRVRRGRLGLTQPAAAARVGVSTRLWSEVERGERPNVSFATVTRMLASVGIHLRARTAQIRVATAGMEHRVPPPYEDDLRAAEAYGVDLSLLRASLRETPLARVRSNDAALAFFSGVSLVRGDPSPVGAETAPGHAGPAQNGRKR